MKPDIRKLSSHRPLLYYIRHGLTDWNAERRFQGRRDIPLNDTGREQARRNGQVLAGLMGAAEGFDFISSPMQRARETMEIIRSEMGLPPEDYRTDERLIERAYGEFEGVSLEELMRDEPEAFARRQGNDWHYTPRGGENLQVTLERVVPLLDALTRPTVIVAHGAVGRTVRKHMLGLDEQEAGGFKFPQDRVFVFEGGVERLV